MQGVQIPVPIRAELNVIQWKTVAYSINFYLWAPGRNQHWSFAPASGRKNLAEDLAMDVIISPHAWGWENWKFCHGIVHSRNKLCAWRHNMPRPSPPRGSPRPRASRRNVAVLSYAEYVPTLTAAAAIALRLSKVRLSKGAWWPWPLTFWLWKWCPSHAWRGLSLCQFWSSFLFSNYARCTRQTDVRQTSDTQTDVRCQTKASLNAPAY